MPASPYMMAGVCRLPNITGKLCAARKVTIPIPGTIYRENLNQQSRFTAQLPNAKDMSSVTLDTS